MEVERCKWVGNDPIYIQYHDEEWGVPQFNDEKLFEAIILDGFQAGLSWITILKKRENFRKAFDSFNAKKIANYKETKNQELLNNKGIIRNNLKIRAAVTNAQAYLQVIEEFDAFRNYIWKFVNYEPLQNNWKYIHEVPASTGESDNMSKDMKKRGFKFCGTTICYAFMQATGMVNDHTINCFKHKLNRQD